jgi:hypothetical protein
MLFISELAHTFKMVDTIPPEVKVGSRVFCDGHYATVLYIGEVPPTEGKYTGFMMRSFYQKMFMTSVSSNNQMMSLIVSFRF